MKKIFVVAFIFLFVSLVGCAQKKIVRPKVDPAVKRLNRAANKIQSELKIFSKLKHAGHDRVNLYNAPQNGTLTKKMTLKWSGPLSDVLKIIAGKIEYKFKVRGESPPKPVLVTVDKIHESAFNVIEDLAWKAGRHSIGINTNKKILQLPYSHSKEGNNG